MAQLVTVSELNDVGDILGAGMSRTGLMERQIVWGEGPWREVNMLRAREMVLEGKAYAKSPRCGNSTECKGQPVPISKVVDGVGTIKSFCQNCWDWSDFHKHRPTPLPMDFLTKWGVFNTRLARPEKGGLRGTLTEEELEKVLSTYVKGGKVPMPPRNLYKWHPTTFFFAFGTQCLIYYLVAPRSRPVMTDGTQKKIKKQLSKPENKYENHRSKNKFTKEKKKVTKKT